MHLTIEQLLSESDFNENIKTLITQSGRKQETKQTYEDCEVNEEHTPESAHAPASVGSGATR